MKPTLAAVAVTLLIMGIMGVELIVQDNRPVYFILLGCLMFWIRFGIPWLVRHWRSGP